MTSVAEKSDGNFQVRSQTAMSEKRTAGLFGRMSGSVRIPGDLIAPIGDAWDAEKTRAATS
jgi:hypothetical protein